MEFRFTPFVNELQFNERVPGQLRNPKNKALRSWQTLVQHLVDEAAVRLSAVARACLVPRDTETTLPGPLHAAIIECFYDAICIP
jgi:hypothetical protein